MASKLSGKVLEVYATMSVKDLQVYVGFKADIFRAYELRLKAYCLQYRSCKKKAGSSSPSLRPIPCGDIQEVKGE